MPIYEFKCRNCQKVFEEFVFSSGSSFEEIECPVCNAKNPNKLMSAFSSSGSESWSTGSSTGSCGSGGFT